MKGTVLLLPRVYAAAACFPSWHCLLGEIHGTHPISRCACATHVFFIQSPCLFIFRHHQNASCYFPPNSGQTNNRCERLEHAPPPNLSPSPPPVLRLVYDNLCTLTLSLFRALLFPRSLPIPRPLCGDIKLHPSPTRSHWMGLCISLRLFGSFLSVCDMDNFSVCRRVLDLRALLSKQWITN